MRNKAGSFRKSHAKTGIMTFQTREAESVKALGRGMNVNKQEG